MISPKVHLDTKHPWDLGRIYTEYLDLGYRECEIAKMVGRSRPTVSHYVRIFRGLHPRTIELLETMNGQTPNILELGKIAKLRDRDDEPDFERQRKALSRIMSVRVTRRR